MWVALKKYASQWAALIFMNDRCISGFKQVNKTRNCYITADKQSWSTGRKLVFSHWSLEHERHSKSKSTTNKQSTGVTGHLLLNFSSPSASLHNVFGGECASDSWIKMQNNSIKQLNAITWCSNAAYCVRWAVSDAVRAAHWWRSFLKKWAQGRLHDTSTNSW